MSHLYLQLFLPFPSEESTDGGAASKASTSAKPSKYVVLHVCIHSRLIILYDAK